ncbi:hypothetical protein [Aquabacterium sp. OR-4]|uniref:hypothetical protein n=1 Tax=Aquabacterium sp. OR-4 TaxID=2978127 RepID=UPI0021B29D1C|nr:hypothetical protein [Aquabacterium sp. OR-4]MDT7834961.1 hypothetical protein [Aquabacterium sp. OR-4]
MSSVARWSYTAAATVWPLEGRDDWAGARTWGAPVGIACDYSGEARRATDAKGLEFTARLTVYTERADIKPGDMVAIGTHTGADPVAAGAVEVRAVQRDADTFDRQADDYTVTG